MEVLDQLHDIVALPMDGELLFPFRYSSGCVLELILMM
jgi:hypothetical protein